MPQDDICVLHRFIVRDSHSHETLAEEILIGLEVADVEAVEQSVALGLLEAGHREVRLREPLLSRETGGLAVMPGEARRGNAHLVADPVPMNILGAVLHSDGEERLRIPLRDAFPPAIERLLEITRDQRRA